MFVTTGNKSLLMRTIKVCTLTRDLDNVTTIMLSTGFNELNSVSLPKVIKSRYTH